MLAAVFACARRIGATPAAAERLVASLSNHRVMVTSNFVGDELVLFGGIEQDAASRPRRGGYDIVVTVTGPRQTMVTFRKAARARHLGQCRFARIRECAGLSGGAVEPAARRHHQRRDAAPAAARPRQHPAAAARQRRISPMPRATIRSASPSSRSRPSRALPRSVERRDVPDAGPVPRLDPAAGRGAGRHLRGRRQAVRRRRA